MTPRAQQSEQPLSAHLSAPTLPVNAVEVRAFIQPVSQAVPAQRPSILERRRRRFGRRVNH